MFFCNDCKIKHEWPGFVESSFGRCEMCGESRACYDVPSSALPPAKREVVDTQKLKGDEKARALILQHLPTDRFVDTFTLTANVHGYENWHKAPWTGGRRGKSPSPNKDRVAKVLNQMRREGLVEYDTESLGRTSRWKKL